MMKKIGSRVSEWGRGLVGWWALLGVVVGCLAVAPVAGGQVMNIAKLGDLAVLEKSIQDITREVTPATVLILAPQTGSSGSGVVVSASGEVLTAAHVIAGAKRVRVVLPDGTEYAGVVRGANFTRDLAHVKIDLPEGEGPLPFAPVGDSREVREGEFVIAMGHPKGYDPTRRPPVRFGRVTGQGSYGFLTTDCTLTGGDSGGPLFDLKGRVVGIHSNIGPDRSINNHAGTSAVLRDWARLREGRQWGRLGPGFGAPPNRAVMGVVLEEKGEGVLQVERVLKGSPAAAAGLRRGDLVREVGGVGVVRLEEVYEVVADFAPGDPLEVLLEREGERRRVELVLTQYGGVY